MSPFTTIPVDDYSRMCHALLAADALAKAAKVFRDQDRPYRTGDARAVDEALAAYEKVRKAAGK